MITRYFRAPLADWFAARRAGEVAADDANPAVAAAPLAHRVLAAKDLVKSFDRRKVVSDVSLHLRTGEVVGLLGPNGAGKTTIFYMLAGMVRPDMGAIELDGADVTSLPMHRRARLGIGYLPQEASIFRELSVENNIRAALQLTQPDRALRAERLESLLDEFSLTSLRRTLGVSLSGGERRRCEIARALAASPHFVLLDEPLAGVDPIAVRDIRTLILDLKNRGIGVLITDHNVRETLKFVDWAYIIHSGRVLVEGPPEDIVADPAARRLYLGEDFQL